MTHCGWMRLLHAVQLINSAKYIFSLHSQHTASLDREFLIFLMHSSVESLLSSSQSECLLNDISESKVLESFEPNDGNSERGVKNESRCESGRRVIGVD